MDLRPAHDDDWPAILGLADAALPWDADGNLEWADTAILSFFQGKGFEERNRFTPIENREMVVMVKRLEKER